MENRTQVMTMGTGDFVEATAAFMEKRPALLAPTDLSPFRSEGRCRALRTSATANPASMVASSKAEAGAQEALWDGSLGGQEHFLGHLDDRPPSAAPPLGTANLAGRCKARPSALVNSALVTGFGDVTLTAPERTFCSSRRKEEGADEIAIG